MSMEIQTFKGYECADFSLRLESVDNDDLYMHVEAKRWTPSVLKEMYRVFAGVCMEAQGLGYKRMCTVTPNPKFASLFGLREINSLDYGNKHYKVMVWDLIQ